MLPVENSPGNKRLSTVKRLRFAQGCCIRVSFFTARCFPQQEVANAAAGRDFSEISGRELSENTLFNFGSFSDVEKTSAEKKTISTPIRKHSALCWTGVIGQPGPRQLRFLKCTRAMNRGSFNTQELNALILLFPGVLFHLGVISSLPCDHGVEYLHEST